MVRVPPVMGMMTVVPHGAHGVRRQAMSPPAFGCTTPRRRFSTRTCAASGRDSGVSITLIPAPRNSRLLCAGVDIETPVGTVWDCLTDYDHLADFIPGLVVNECLQKRRGGARLRQVGRQDLYLGIQFCATAILDIAEHGSGLPVDSIFSIGKTSLQKWEEEGLFPCPRSECNDGLRDISFCLVEGDFQAFKGVWRMEIINTGTSRLSYALHVRPQRWLPVGLIQGRIKQEIENNLLAVKNYAESI